MGSTPWSEPNGRWVDSAKLPKWFNVWGRAYKTASGRVGVQGDGYRDEPPAQWWVSEPAKQTDPAP